MAAIEEAYHTHGQLGKIQQRVHVGFGRWLGPSLCKILCVRLFKFWDFWIAILGYFWLRAISPTLSTPHCTAREKIEQHVNG